MASKIELQNFWQNKKVLITGHTGFTGSWMSLILHELGSRVCGISDKIPTQPAAFEVLEIKKIVEHHIGDISNYSVFETVYLDFKPDIVIHLAAQPLVIYAYSNPYETFMTNAVGTLNVLETIKKHPLNTEVILNVTTDKVYLNSDEGVLFSESSALGGLEPYSASKVCSEWMTESYQISYFKKIPLIVARAGNIIGGGDWSENRLLVDAAKLSSLKKPIVIRNPHATRPWQHVAEIVRGYLSYIFYAYKNINCEKKINLGPKQSECWTVESVMNCFCREWGGSSSWQIDSSKSEIKESKLLSLNATKAKEILNWDNKYSTDEGIKRTVRWYKSYYNDSKYENLKELCLKDFFESF